MASGSVFGVVLQVATWDGAAEAVSGTGRKVGESESGHTSPVHAEGREQRELESVVASGGESGRGARVQLGGGEALDETQAAAATRTPPTGLDRIFVGKRDPA